MIRRLHTQAPFAFAALLFLVALTVVCRMSYQANAGHLVYTLDDPYIHMAIAKNLAAHGVFGVTRYEFSSSASSPLWTLLIAASYKLLGPSDWLPGMWAAVFALAGLYATDLLCRLIGLKPITRFIICCAVIYFTPLIPLVSTGMEHAMHLFFVLILIISTIRYADFPSRSTVIPLCLAGLLATATRYESLFLVAPIAFFLLIRRRWFGAPALVMSSFFPVIAYGVFSILNGSYFLPNSLMLKGHFHDINSLRSLVSALGYGFGLLTVTDHLYSTSILLLLGAFLFDKRRKSSFPVALCLVVSMLLHLQFARIGWFYRYEAYLVGASIPVLGCLYLGPVRIPLRSLISGRKLFSGVSLLACAVLLLWPLYQRGSESLLLWPLHKRGSKSLKNVVPASNNIYRQQYQMGHFLRKMYEAGVRIAVNDLGAVTYYADTDVLDLVGLGTIDVTRALRDGSYDSVEIERLLRRKKTDIVMVYEDWFSGRAGLPRLPNNLVAVADWTTTNNFFGKTVTFLASSEETAQVLVQRLHSYQDNLPDSVEVSYHITEQGPERVNQFRHSGEMSK